MHPSLKSEIPRKYYIEYYPEKQKMGHLEQVLTDHCYPLLKSIIKNEERIVQHNCVIV